MILLGFKKIGRRQCTHALPIVPRKREENGFEYAPRRIPNRVPLPELIGSGPVETDTDPDADDGEDDAEEDERSGFAHRFHANVHHHPHDEEEHRTVDAQVVVQHVRLLSGVPKEGDFRSDVVLCAINKYRR